MPHAITHAMMSHAHYAVHTCRQAGCPNDFMAHCNLIICLLFAQAKGLLLKITTSHFNTLTMQFANENMLERILIAM